ncbi:MAG: hypothetical protein Q9202_000944 [Teloschistes flavicans]
MFPSFTGSTRRPRQVNLSGRNSNPFAATTSSRQPLSAQTTQNTVAHAQAERAIRQQERRRPPAAITIQRSWRGYHSRRIARTAWRRDWDAREETDPWSGAPTGVGDSALIPYQSEAACLHQMKLLVHFASPGDRGDVDRLQHFARRYRDSISPTGSACSSNVWIFPLLLLGKLTISVLEDSKSLAASVNVPILLQLLGAIATSIPEQLSSYSMRYYGALRNLALTSGKGNQIYMYEQEIAGKMVIAALLRPKHSRSADAYQGFASQFLRVPGIPVSVLQALSTEMRTEDLTLALGSLLSAPPADNLLEAKGRDDLLWLTAYFLYLYRSTRSDHRSSIDALYVSVLSRLISHLSGEIASRIDATPNTSSADSTISTSASPATRSPLPPFVRAEIMQLVSQDHVSSLLYHAATPNDSTDALPLAERKKGISALAVYALTLLRAFPRRGDEIRMWLIYGAAPVTDAGKSASIPAIKYYYNAASQTTIYSLVKSDPVRAIGLLNPGARRAAKEPILPERDEQWQIILLFLELYPIVLKVMDDEEFLTGANATDPSDSWTRRSALALEQVKDLSLFLKSLAFSMYWNASEIAGVEEPENKNSIAEYFSGNLAAFSDHHPDAKTPRSREVTMAGLPGMTVQYVKGMVTGLLRMIYERDSRRRFLPSDHWLMTQWFEMDRFISAVVQEEEEKHKIQESYGVDIEDKVDEPADDESMEEEEEGHDDLIGTQRAQQVRRIERLRRQQRKVSRRKYLESVTPRLEILQNMPFFIPFATRVQIFRQFVLLDQVRRRGTADADLWRFSMMNAHRSEMGKHRAKVRRESIFDDAFNQFYELGEGLKEPIQISFVDKFDTIEEGIDGGGVTKEFLTSVTSEAFNSMNGLDMFVENDQHLLYPNPTAVDERKELLTQASEPEGSAYYNESVRDLLRRFEFMGRIIGKCLYEGILVDIHFAPFFLLKWVLTGGLNAATKESSYRANLNDLRDLDEALYQGLLQLKNYAGNVESLGLSFEVTDTLFPSDHPSTHTSQAPIARTRELYSGGSAVPVTNANRLVYISYMAQHRLSRQPFPQTAAFLKGLATIVAPGWLSMFNQHELQTLVSGTADGIDIADLRRNTQYSGLYAIGDDGLEHPTIRLFWRTVETFTDQDKANLVRFVTSTPRAPLLGFGNLNPKFSIRDGGGDEKRLPTTSTCVNLLKLPLYTDAEVLRERLLYSVRAGAGFDLS